MDIRKIKAKRKELISDSNLEWREILDLSSDVQKDFNDNESLTIPLYNKILDWKLSGQTALLKKIRTGSPDSLIQTITHCYFKVDHPDDDMKTRIKVHVLLSIPWIGIGVASAIMALHEPRIYAGIDSRTWAALFNEDKKTFSIKHYETYLSGIGDLADKVGCDVQEIGYILWKQYEV